MSVNCDEEMCTLRSASRRSSVGQRGDRPETGEQGSGAPRLSGSQGAAGMPVTAEGIGGCPSGGPYPGWTEAIPRV